MEIAKNLTVLIVGIFLLFIGVMGMVQGSITIAGTEYTGPTAFIMSIVICFMAIILMALSLSGQVPPPDEGGSPPILGGPE